MQVVSSSPPPRVRAEATPSGPHPIRRHRRSAPPADLPPAAGRAGGGASGPAALPRVGPHPIRRGVGLGGSPRAGLHGRIPRPAERAARALGWCLSPEQGCLAGDEWRPRRAGELINHDGEKISPIEVDAVLLDHPAVKQAISFGILDDKYGEEIYCVVIPRGGAALAEYEVITAFTVRKKVYITDDLPKTATGNIQRRIVAQHFKERAG